MLLNREFKLITFQKLHWALTQTAIKPFEIKAVLYQGEPLMPTPIVQHLAIDNWLFKQIKEDKATAILRPFRQHLRVGSYTLRNFQTGEEVQVRITDVQYWKFQDVTLGMAQALGFETLGFMRTTLAWAYKFGSNSVGCFATFKVL